MTSHEKACALAAQAGADLARLGAALGTELPTAEGIRIILEKAGHARDEVRAAVYDLYLDIRNQLAGTDPGTALAFGLGRLLRRHGPAADERRAGTADRTVRPVPDGERPSWLDDLDARAPCRSASAVRASLRQWERWIGGWCDPARRIDPAQIDEGVIRALRRRGSVWRRLLTGQQAADQLLDGRAYVGAAASLLANGRRLVFHYMWKWSWAILIAAGAIGATVWTAVTYAPGGNGPGDCRAGIRGRFPGPVLGRCPGDAGRALRQAEHAMWEAEVVEAIGKAATPSGEAERPARSPAGPGRRTQPARLASRRWREAGRFREFGYGRYHCWLALPVQSQICSLGAGRRRPARVVEALVGLRVVERSVGLRDEHLRARCYCSRTGPPWSRWRSRRR